MRSKGPISAPCSDPVSCPAERPMKLPTNEVESFHGHVAGQISGSRCSLPVCDGHTEWCVVVCRLHFTVESLVLKIRSFPAQSSGNILKSGVAVVTAVIPSLCWMMSPTRERKRKIRRDDACLFLPSLGLERRWSG